MSLGGAEAAKSINTSNRNIFILLEDSLVPRYGLFFFEQRLFQHNSCHNRNSYMYIYLFPEIRRQQINEKEHFARTDTMRIQTNKVGGLKPIMPCPCCFDLFLLFCLFCLRGLREGGTRSNAPAGPPKMRAPTRKRGRREERSSVMLPSSGSNRNPYRRRGL